MVELREGSALLHLMNSGPGLERSRAPRPTSGAARKPRAAATPQREHDHQTPEATVTCGFCGHAFVEDRSQATCQACPLHKACGLMRCPNCGYENPKQPGWIARIKEWIR